MKKLTVALVCALGIVACGEKQQAATPSSQTTTTSGMADPNALPPLPAPTTQSAPMAPSTPPPSSTMAPEPMAPSTPPMDGSGMNAPPTTDSPTGSAPSNVTPMDSGGGTDLEITAAIRRSVVDDHAMSATAKNVKIITVSGKVTLRGQVKSADEKAGIEAKAKSTPGVSGVDNQLQVKK